MPRRLYRIFVRDRGNQMYSGLKEVQATTPGVALRDFHGPRGFFKAIPWPPIRPRDKAWLHRYVGD